MPIPNPATQSSLLSISLAPKAMPATAIPTLDTLLADKRSLE